MKLKLILVASLAVFSGAMPAAQASTIPYTTYATFPDQAYDAAPYRAVGRLFFTNGFGLPSSCSATSVGGAHRSTVLTAAHCIWNPDTGGTSSNFIFTPSYHNGANWPGNWFGVQASAFIPTAYLNSNATDHNKDVGYVSFSKRPGDLALADVVGKLEQVFNATNRSSYLYHMAGYPSSGAYPGEYMMNCDSEYGGTIDLGSGTNMAKIGCDWLVGGSSGSAVWIYFTGYSTQGGWNSVTHVLSGIESGGPADVGLCAILGDAAFSSFTASGNTAT